MTKIFQVLLNLKDGDGIHKVGEFIEGEYEALKSLVETKTIRLIEGAESITHAKEIVAQEASEVGASATAEKALEPENTWGPKKDEAPADKKTEENKDAGTETKTDAVKTEDKVAEDGTVTHLVTEQDHTDGKFTEVEVGKETTYKPEVAGSEVGSTAPASTDIKPEDVNEANKL